MWAWPSVSPLSVGTLDRLALRGYTIVTTEGENMAKKKKTTPKRRNMVAFAMMMRSAKAGRHSDKRKAHAKKACRGKVRW